MAADTIRFIVTVAIVVYKGLIPVVGRMLTLNRYYISKRMTTFHKYQKKHILI